MRPAPTGTGCMIEWNREVEDTKEPMHTCSGVPGLSGYPTICYFVPALIKCWCWGPPIGISTDWIIGGGGGGGWVPGRLVFQNEWTLFQATGTVALWPWHARHLVACPFTPKG